MNTSRKLKSDAEKLLTKKIKSVIEQMKKLGSYRPEFEDTVRHYAELCIEYDTLYERYVAANYPCAIDTEKGAKKSPITTTLESLRKDILAYAVQLGLTPAAIKKLKDDALAKQKQDSELEKVLRDFGK